MCCGGYSTIGTHNMRLIRDDFFYYDYAGGTYYAVKLCWFFNAPDGLEGLVWTDGKKIRWHLHGSNDCNGVYDEHYGYHNTLDSSEELLNYFQEQRNWSNSYRNCKTKEERIQIMNSFRKRITN